MTPDLATIAATVRRAAGDLPSEALPDLVAALEAARALAYVRLTRPPSAPAPAIPVTERRAVTVDADTLAEMTQLKPSWIRDRARRGKIPVIYAGRYMRFRVDDVLQALEGGVSCRRRRRKGTHQRSGGLVEAQDAAS